MSDSQGTRFALDLSLDDVAPHVGGVGAFLLAYALLLRGIELGRLYAFGDFVPYYGSRAFAKFLGTWHDGGLGFPYVYNVMPAYLGTVTAVGGALGQNLFYLALVPAGFATFLVFARRFVERPVPRYLAAGVYAINPVTIGEFVNGGVSTLIGFVGFPLIVHYLYRIDEEDAWRPAALVGVVFGATAIVPWLVFWMIGPFAAYFAYRSRRDPRKFAKFVAGGTLGVVLSLPNVHHIVQRAAGFGDGDGVLWTTLQWNYEQADPLAVVRLAGNHGMLAMNQLGYNTDPTMVVGLVVPAVALFAYERDRLRLYYAIAVGCVGFVVLTGLGLTYPLFETVPLFWSVRNPAKLQYPLLLSLSLLFGAGLETVLHGARGAVTGLDIDAHRGRASDARDPLLRGVVVGLVVLSLVAYAAPAAGAYGLEGVRGDDYAVPAEYDAVADEVDGRALWVPYGYTTQLRLRETHPNHVGIKSGGVVQGIPNVDYVTRLFEDVAAGEPVHQRLRDLGVEYVVVESDPPGDYGAGAPRVQSKWGAPWLFGDPATLNERFATSDAYERAFSADGFTVYRVTGVPDRDRVVRNEGLHAVVYPEETDTEVVGDNLLANPSFDDGTGGWWTPPNESGRTTTYVETADGGAVELRVSGDTQPLPVAQATATRDDYPYRVNVDATGDGVATLYWYEGEKSPDSLVSREVVPLSAFPKSVTAKGDTLSIRIKPNASSEVVVREVTVARSSYPAATEFTAASGGVPGVVVDGRDDPPGNATVVAANLGPEAASDAGADVRIVDAETVLDGDLAFDDDYRQGAGVLLADGEHPDAVPDDARLVTHETEAGTVLDYWVVGSFDDTPVTTVRTSYAAGWSGSPDAEHFRAQGWANGFTDTTPDEVSWTGGGLRGLVVRVWLGAWAVTLLVLAGPPVARRLRERFDDGDQTSLP
ncbi:hypothetical protein [Halobaculum marinum]|uniref:Membrane protein YfhO n=1 Tax=Halobaculum marinum TaxID=3031996 RepID=A0ABD5WW52_9EURY|nr:hypothetical protein [Halobaculum sp. DT55]